MKKTAWINGMHKPVRQGWYECAYGDSRPTHMRYWTGSVWLVRKGCAVVALFGLSRDNWRGVTKP